MFKTLIIVFAQISLLIVILGCGDSNSNTSQELWTDQFGTPGADQAISISIDVTNNIFVVGRIGNSPSPEEVFGVGEGYITKYDSQGIKLWTDQFGSRFGTGALDVALDTAGNAYVVGWADSDLPGQVHFGRRDAFIRKYDDTGNLLWTNQFGTPERDELKGIAISGSGDIFVVGIENEKIQAAYLGQSKGKSFVYRFNSDGDLVWRSEISSNPGDRIEDIVVSNSNDIYITGHTSIELGLEGQNGEIDAFVARLGDDGQLSWLHQFGSSLDDKGRAVVLDEDNNLYFTGRWEGSQSSGTSGGGYVGSYKPDGTFRWLETFGLDSGQSAESLVATSEHVIVVGRMVNNLDMVTDLDVGSSEPDLDVGLWIYSKEGELIEFENFGTPSTDEASDVASTNFNEVYIVGRTSGQLATNSEEQGFDAFVRGLLIDIGSGRN